jgi:hypothetical protein
MIEIETLKNGARNPVIDTRMDKIPPLALLAVGRALKHGMKYEADRPDNWRGVPAHEHLNHALRHIALWQSGDTSDDHVSHILSRMMMWGELVLGGGNV